MQKIVRNNSVKGVASDDEEMNTARDVDMSQWYVDFKEIVLGEEIGRGAFGVVYKGEWRGSVVAIKKMLMDNLLNKDPANFKAEASLMKSLRPHSNVVMLLGLCESPLCLITEFCSNGSLSTLLLSKADLNSATKYQITLGVTAGMLHLHSENVVHRDLAARNVLLTPDNVPKITDFGLARINIKDENITKSTIGPLKWMAPESIKSQKYSFKSDVWSYGITVIEIYSRKMPYPELDGVNVAIQVVGGTMQHPVPGDAPADIAAIIKKCTQFKPENRPTFKEISTMFTSGK